jgi:hypothetical protein
LDSHDLSNDPKSITKGRVHDKCRHKLQHEMIITQTHATLT